MSKAGQRLLQGVKEALAYADGTANPDEYRVHYPEDIARYPTDYAAILQDEDSQVEPKVVAMPSASQSQSAASG